MPAQVDIQGSGIAASCCAHLLGQKGITISFSPLPRGAGPSLLINPSTQTLLAEVFGRGDGLFAGLPTIRKRVVLWGKESPVTLPHSGVVVNENVLLERLWSVIEKSSPCTMRPADFTIHSATSPANDGRQSFGSRQAIAVTVGVRQTAAQACWIEALEAGWLFLLPTGDFMGTLLAVGDSPAALLDQSRLVGGQIESLVGVASTFGAHPQILDPLCGPNWLACGTAAMSFDPICGEGAGNAVREAILAAAVIPLMLRECSREDVIDHYASRLTAGFVRHLTVCREFYGAACAGTWWKSELADLERGIAWAGDRLSCAPAPQYRLVGFDLAALNGQAASGSSRGQGRHNR